ncbi:NEDD4-binding protein 2-like 2 isoform X3 [Neoarius graeffei]|uniref:NEDD4-binding protein 2-like 2 isoform X3 n=1 Tax=Neoarius graeffei TaxID=443677 RepID=UPI00298CCCE0|nr:NEDD4-binding protein 2-like 2 isoform X3 [Neoarius graeffei]
MPHVNPPGSSLPPVSGSVEDPPQLDQAETLSDSRTFPEGASNPGRFEQQSVLDCVEVVEVVKVVEVNPSPEQLNTGDEKSSGDDERACSGLRNREEVIKEISISSTTFIGPVYQPQPAIEDELSEFYKELEQIEQLETGDGNSERISWSNAPPETVNVHSEHLSQSCGPPDPVDGTSEHLSLYYAPPDHVDGTSEHPSQFYAPPETVDGTSEHLSQSYAPPPAIKEKGNNHRNAYRPYPATWQHTEYRNTPQWRPQSSNTTCDWSNPHSYQNQWQLPPPNFPFYPPPQPGNPTHPQYSQCNPLETSGSQFASSHSPAPYAPYEAFETQQYEEQSYQDVNQHNCNYGPALVLILMRGVPGSGKSTLARQISSSGPSGLVLSTDDYFYQKDGYHFEPTLLSAAHDWNQNRAKKAMLDRCTPVVIDNTNVQAWEMKPYVTLALETGYRVEFVEPETSWKCDPVELENDRALYKERERAEEESSLPNQTTCVCACVCGWENLKITKKCQ